MVSRMFLTTTIADLEAYGLSLKTINFLEDHFGILYVSGLRGLTEEMVLESSRGGPGVVDELRRVLLNFLAGRVVKGVDACVCYRRGR